MKLPRKQLERVEVGVRLVCLGRVILQRAVSNVGGLHARNRFLAACAQKGQLDLAVQSRVARDSPAVHLPARPGP